MTVQHKELKKPNVFANGIDFKPYYKAGVKGLSDIDAIYERKGKFIIFDEKKTKFDKFRLYWGQFQMYRKLYQALADRSKIFFSVFHNRNVYIFFVKDMTTGRNGKYRFSGDKHIFYEDIPLSDGVPMTKDEYYQWFYALTRELDK